MTDGEGIARLRVPNAVVELSADAMYFTGDPIMVPADASQATIELTPWTDVTVTVVDAATGKVVQTERVFVTTLLNGSMNHLEKAEWKEDAWFGQISRIADVVEVRIEAHGYAVKNVQSPLTPGEPIQLRAELTPATDITGRVINDTGQPAAATAMLQSIRYLQLSPHSLTQRGFDWSTPAAVTDDEGRFAIPHDDTMTKLLVQSEDGYAVVSLDELAEMNESDEPIRLMPWRPITVTVTADGQPLPSTGLGWEKDVSDRIVDLSVGFDTDHDGQGHLARSAGDVGHLYINPPASSALVKQRLHFDSEGPAFVDVDLSGSLAATLAVPEGLPEGWAYEYAILSKAANDDADPATAPRNPLADYPTDDWPTTATLHLRNSDGRVIFPNVPPGRYLLTITAGVIDTGWACSIGMPVARKQLWVTLGEEPVDLGEIMLEATPRPVAGDPAPPFTAVDLDNKPLALQDYAGKYILIDFWAVWCAPCLAEMPRLRMIRDAYANDDRLVIMSVSADQSLETAREYVTGNDMTGPNWKHAYSGLPSPIMEQYAVPSIPSAWLIAPDGRILARDLRGEELSDFVRKTLGEPQE